MYQMHFEGGDVQSFEAFVKAASERVSREPHACALFHVFNDTAQREVTDRAVGVLRSVAPHISFVGCSTSGNISNGAYVSSPMPNLSAVCNVFESSSTQVEVHQFPLNRDSWLETSDAIVKLIDERPWVKAVEMLTTLIDVGMVEFCDQLHRVRKDVVVFGGAALSSETVNMWAGLPYVFSSAGDNSGGSTVIALFGGDDFHATTQTVLGWKPLGRPMDITRSIGPVLYELDNVPAFERFRHYLAIESGERFAQTGFMFPVAIEQNGRSIIKAPVNVDKNGAITLTSDLATYHKKCRIAYGDPGTILRSIKESATLMQDFEPQGIWVYSCAARRMYWGDDNISRETLPLQEIAPTSGFYTGGEFSREGDTLLHHNVTLVLTGIREGDPTGKPKREIEINATEFTRQMNIVSSLASFVGVTSSELEEAYRQLAILAKTDGLTDLLNRRAIETHIVEALEDSTSNQDILQPSVIMLDIDDFKQANDAYGHKAGDDVLKRFGELLQVLVDNKGIGYSGRWGGEEFMALLPQMALETAQAVAQDICDEFASIEFHASGTHTVSAGVAQALPGETSDLLCQRVDKALYAAKHQGKNCVVVV